MPNNDKIKRDEFSALLDELSELHKELADLPDGGADIINRLRNGDGDDASPNTGDASDLGRDRRVPLNPDRREGTPPSPAHPDNPAREGGDSSPSTSNRHSDNPASKGGDSDPTKRTRADASRENGSKSRGPITQEGKDISRYGAWKHGLTAATVLGSPAELERFHHFTVGLKNDLEPKGVLEITLIESLATAQWQFDRCRANEINIQFEAATKYMEETPEGHDETIAWARAQAKAMEEKSIVLDRLGRYGARHHRQILQIFDCFQKTKRDRINGEYAEIRENKKKHNQALAKHQQAAASGEPRPTGRGPSGSEPRPTGRGPSEDQSNQPGKPAPGFVCPDPEPPSSKEPRA